MWLCVDQGGHSTRAAVFDPRGDIVARASAPVSTQRLSPTRIEHDPEELLRSAAGCIRSIAEQLGRTASHLRGAAVATQRSTLACASRRSGEPLTPLISWQDRRGADDLARFERDTQTIKRITGLRLSPHYGIGKLRWCLQHEPRVRESVARGDLVAAPLASLLVHHLCVERPWVIDPVNASRTLLMDLRTAAWSEPLLSLFDVPHEVLPSIHPNRSRFGTIAIGDVSVPLTTLTGDQAAAVFSRGEPSTERGFVNIGTGAFIQVATGTSPVDDEALLSSVVWQDESAIHYVLEGTVNGAGSAIDAVSQSLDVTLDPTGSGLKRALASIEEAPLFLNGVAGLGSPDWNPDFESRFVGDGDETLRIAATYESIGFLVRRNLDRMRRRVKVTALTVSGGLSRLDWLVRLIADLSGLPVHRPDDPEATLTGLAYLASGGRLVGETPARTFAPRPNRVAERRYADWSRALDAALGSRPTHPARSG